MKDRCKNLPQHITLAAEVPERIPVLDKDGNATGTTKDSLETKKVVCDLKLVLPGLGWSPLAIETGNRIAAAIDFTAKSMVDEGTLTDIEEAKRSVTLSFLPQIFTMYYIGKDETIFIASRQSEKISAFQYSVYPLTDAQEEEMLTDFFDYCRRYKRSTRISSTNDTPEKEKSENVAAD